MIFKYLYDLWFKYEKKSWNISVVCHEKNWQTIRRPFTTLFIVGGLAFIGIRYGFLFDCLPAIPAIYATPACSWHDCCTNAPYRHVLSRFELLLRFKEMLSTIKDCLQNVLQDYFEKVLSHHPLISKNSLTNNSSYLELIKPHFLFFTFYFRFRMTSCFMYRNGIFPKQLSYFIVSLLLQLLLK